QVALEAIRAVHDEEIPSLLPALASLSLDATQAFPAPRSDPAVQRVLNANFRLGDAPRLVELASRNSLSRMQQMLVHQLLSQWTEPAATDAVTGELRRLSPRSGEAIKASLEAALPGMLQDEARLDVALINLGKQYSIDAAIPALVQIFANPSLTSQLRVAALEGLLELAPERRASLVEDALRDDAHEVRVRALGWLQDHTDDQEQVLSLLQAAMQRNQWAEQQAVIPLLAACSSPRADALLKAWLARLASGETAPEIALELLEAAERRKLDSPRIDGTQFSAAHFPEAKALPDAIKDYWPCLLGGDAERGERVFRERNDLACTRCHLAGEEGTSVGPNLTEIGKTKPRPYLLEAVLLPNQAIARGFESTVVVTDEGVSYTGIVSAENEEWLELLGADGSITRVAKPSIEERAPALSAMPDDLGKLLTRHELRDLIAFLAQLQGPSNSPPQATGHAE
ncbi:MAG: c-type cytochrome, partial [Planctomycetales bacterium]|nr:c-type cytochrome [Planctomycetales bacterium]